MTAMHGTVYYVSPEVMKGSYDERCDLWSIGVIMFMLLSGSPPFNGTCDAEILEKISLGKFDMTGDRWKLVSANAKSFISSLLQVDLAARSTAAQALSHPWLKQDLDGESEPIDRNVLENMQAFACANVMKRAALCLIAYSMDPAEVHELEKTFKRLDKGQKGVIHLKDLSDVLHEELKLPHREVSKIFQRIDQTGDSEIHYSEFLASTLDAKYHLQENIIRDVFDKFDVDNTGFISKENLEAVLGSVHTGVKVEDIIASFDFKKTGHIDFEEFLHAVLSEEGSLASYRANSNDFIPNRASLNSLTAMIRDVSQQTIEPDFIKRKPRDSNNSLTQN
eukprot:Filipodium_phascolosomae@DN533_c0_g1_i2.p1